MASINIYSAKAERYARYRWEYAPQAVDLIFTRTGLDRTSIAVELGAGTGILTRKLVPRLKYIFAIEPDLEMNRWILEGLPPGSPISVLCACAEAIPLPARCADLVVVAQAIHWFNPPLARVEIQRLLKLPGWLVLLRNYSTAPALAQELKALNTPEYGAEVHPQQLGFEPQPINYYYGHSNFECLRFPFIQHQDWDAFWGSLCTASFAPEESHPLYPRYRYQAQKIFQLFAVNGILETTGETEIIIGQCM